MSDNAATPASAAPAPLPRAPEKRRERRHSIPRASEPVPTMRFALPPESDDAKAVREQRTTARKHHATAEQELRRAEVRHARALREVREAEAEHASAAQALPQAEQRLASAPDDEARAARAAERDRAAQRAAAAVTRLDIARKALPATMVPSELRARFDRARDSLTRIREGSNQVDDWMDAYRSFDCVPPYVDPLRCIDMVINSDALSKCVGVMANNVGAHGYTLESRLSSEALSELEAQAKGKGKRPKGEAKAAKGAAAGSKTTAQATLDAIAKEKLQIERFFNHCHPKLPFVELQRRKTADREMTGYHGWEILRDGQGKISVFVPMRAWSFRLTAPDDEVDAAFPVEGEDGTWTNVTMPWRFRRIVQTSSTVRTYFKEFGDPRFIDKATGYTITDPGEQDVLREQRREAREVLLFTQDGVSGGITPYGLPRWLGALLSALGRRDAGEVNWLHFRNKAIPPMVVLVSGGELTDESFKEIEDRFRDGKGIEAYHDIMILEAQPTDPGGITGVDAEGKQNVRIEFKPMNVQTDGQFATYRKDSLDDVRMTFGFPKLFLGFQEDANRATAETAVEMTDKQVFAPERVVDDFVINNVLFPAMGFRYWKFKTSSASISDDDAIAKLIEAGVAGDGLSPDDVRMILSRALDMQLPSWGQPWSGRPVSINKGMASLGIDFTDESLVGNPMPGAQDPGDEDGGGGGGFGGPKSKGPGKDGGGGDPDTGNAEADAAEAAAERGHLRAASLLQRRRFIRAQLAPDMLAGATVGDEVRLASGLTLRLVTDLADEVREELEQRITARDRAEAAG